MRRVVLLLPLFAAALSRCGSTMPGAVTSDGRPFDYARPPCTSSLVAAAGEQVDVRYLGSGGVYVGWRGDAILLGPFFSNPRLVASLFGNLRHDRARIARHLRDVLPASVRA